jgi:reactive intermediate/imine deaminase
MKLLTATLVALLLFAISSAADDSDRKHISMKRTAEMNLPFSDGVLVGNTLYVAGHLGLDPKTGKPPASAEDEAKFALDGIKEVVDYAGMTMDDLVSVQVFCSDLSLYDTFNSVYRTYFHGSYPARAFVGSGSLLRGARFEVTGIAVKKTK